MEDENREQKIKIVDLQEMYMIESMYSRQRIGQTEGEKQSQRQTEEGNQPETKRTPSTIRYKENEQFERFDEYSYPDIKDKNKEDYMPLKTILDCEEYENRKTLAEDVLRRREIASECIRGAFLSKSEKEPIILVVPSYACLEACLDVQGCVENNGIRVLHVIPRCMAMAFSFYEKDRSADQRLESWYNVIDIGDDAISINTVLVKEQTVTVEKRHAYRDCGYWSIVQGLEHEISESFAADHHGPQTDEEHWEVYKMAMKFFMKGEDAYGNEMVFNGCHKRTDEVKKKYRGIVKQVVDKIKERCKKNIPLLLCGRLQESKFGQSVKDALQRDEWARDKVILDGDETGIEGAGRIFFGDVELFYHSNPWSCSDDSCIYSLRTGSMRLFPTGQKWKVQSCDRIWGSVSLVGEDENFVVFMIAKTKKSEPRDGQREEYEVSKLMKIPIIKKEEKEKATIMLETFVVNKHIIYYHITDRKAVYTPLKRFDFGVDFGVDFNDSDDTEEVYE